VTRLDRWTVGYAAVSSAVLLLRWSRVPMPGLLAAAHVLLLLVVWLAMHLRQRRAGAFLAEFYPVIFVTALYTELGVLNAAQDVSHDALVQSWDRALFGGQPSLDWIRTQPWPFLSAILHSAYMAYYIVVPGAPLGLWLSGRREASRETLLRIMATFYVCYTIFLLFPVAGPRYVFPMAENAATTVGPARWVHAILQSGSAWGTAFPSSHVAVTVVAALSAFLAWPKLGRPLVILTVCLTLGTVYGQFHYGTDALAGTFVGIAMLRVRNRAPVTRPSSAAPSAIPRASVGTGTS
jgi:membrane-associated phospholipid phosphatase